MIAAAPSWRRAGRAGVALIASVLAVACAGPAASPRVDDTIAAFAEPGPYPVGYTHRWVSYPDVVDEGDRTVPLYVWYPAGAPSPQKAVYGVLFIQLESPVATYDAAPATDGPFPLVVYSHGSGGEPALAYPYGEHLASHGYVVAAVGHRGNTTTDNLLGGSALFLENVVRRPSDVGAVIDFFADRGEDELLGATSTERVLQFGHSFGGFTTFANVAGPFDLDTIDREACAEPDADCSPLDNDRVRDALAAGFVDERIAAIAPQAPAFAEAFAPEALAALPIPTLLMSGRRDLTLPDEEQAQVYWAGLDHPDDIWFEIPAGGHQSFIPTCDDLTPWQQDLFLYRAEEDGCGSDFVATGDLLPLMSGYLRRFADRHIKQIPVTGDWHVTPPVDEVRVRRHP